MSDIKGFTPVYAEASCQKSVGMKERMLANRWAVHLTHLVIIKAHNFILYPKCLMVIYSAKSDMNCAMPDFRMHAKQIHVVTFFLLFCISRVKPDFSFSSQNKIKCLNWAKMKKFCLFYFFIPCVTLRLNVFVFVLINLLATGNN